MGIAATNELNNSVMKARGCSVHVFGKQGDHLSHFKVEGLSKPRVSLRCFIAFHSSVSEHVIVLSVENKIPKRLYVYAKMAITFKFATLNRT